MLLKKITLQNFRGFDRIDVDLDSTTVLIGENNCGKTSLLAALDLCLGRSAPGRTHTFTDYDYHLPRPGSEPGDAGPIVVTLTFAENKKNEWDPDVAIALADAIDFRGDLREVTLRVTSTLDAQSRKSTLDWQFLDVLGNVMPRPKPAATRELQRLKPLFYLSAVRDSTEFQPRSSYWGPFLRNPQIPQHDQERLQAELERLNSEILALEPRLADVRTRLAKSHGLVSLSAQDTFSIDAVPGKAWELLSRAQVNVAGPSGAKLPLQRHGAGTQSLSVLFLFEAFLSSMLKETYDPLSVPVIALEEPEAHLHPSAIRALWGVLTQTLGQKIIATHSGELLAQVPLASVRRLHRRGNRVEVGRVNPATLSDIELRKLEYFVRATRGELMFARCWLLGEGQSEFWVLRAAAEAIGVDLDRSGIRLITDYAHAGDTCFSRLADALGISWHFLLDGDNTGQTHATALAPELGQRPPSDHMTQLPAVLEEYLAAHGFGAIYLARVPKQNAPKIKASPSDPHYWREVVAALPDKRKTQCASEVAQAMLAQTTAVPPLIRLAIETARRLASA